MAGYFVEALVISGFKGLKILVNYRMSCYLSKKSKGVKMPVKREEFPAFSLKIRSKPGMYFASGGREAIPRMVEYLVVSVLDHEADVWSGNLDVFISNGGGQEITVTFEDMVNRQFLPVDGADWFADLFRPQSWWPSIIAAASSRFVLESSDGVKKRRMEICDGAEMLESSHAGDGKSYLRFGFTPAAGVFQSAGHEEYYKICGWLRDLSMLRSGVKTCFKADDWEGEMSSYYKFGMKSYLFETDYVRFNQHPGCLQFSATQADMKVECYLRFIHAGTPYVKNFVNHFPTQGGSHLEGLGKALRELFPESTRGCRQSRFVTNPDTNEGVVIPRPFIGVMHLQLDDPRYFAPTKDVLRTEGVAKFVYKAAAETLKEQWRELNPPVDHEAIYRKMMESKRNRPPASGSGMEPITG
jgi:DNA gyrase/topoisomerase IV subunit B